MEDLTDEPSLNRRVGDGVRGELARSGMSLAELARHLGMSPTSLRRRLSDDVSFTIDEVEIICRLFNINLYELLRLDVVLEGVRITAAEVIVEKGTPVVVR